MIIGHQNISYPGLHIFEHCLQLHAVFTSVLLISLQYSDSINALFEKSHEHDKPPAQRTEENWHNDASLNVAWHFCRAWAFF